MSGEVAGRRYVTENRANFYWLVLVVFNMLYLCEVVKLRCLA